ncbi:ATP-binding cassette domain-containing protein, partial [Acinetobacter baumannii]
ASISIEHVYVEFGSRVVLQDLNLAIPAGAFVALTGHTGSGKTTLLDCILGLRMPTSGKVRVDGYDLSSLPGRHWRQGIGYLGQDPMLF